MGSDDVTQAVIKTEAASSPHGTTMGLGRRHRPASRTVTMRSEAWTGAALRLEWCKRVTTGDEANRENASRAVPAELTTIFTGSELRAAPCRRAGRRLIFWVSHADQANHENASLGPSAISILFVETWVEKSIWEMLGRPKLRPSCGPSAISILLIEIWGGGKLLEMLVRPKLAANLRFRRDLRLGWWGALGDVGAIGL